MTAWCELSGDLRLFRTGSVECCERFDDHFENEPGKTQEDYLHQVTVQTNSDKHGG